MNKRTRQIKFAADTETQRRSREIQILVNILEPDPLLQPYFISDKATVGDVSMETTEAILWRLESYFGKPLMVSLEQPLWKIVEQLKQIYKGWPDDWPPPRQ